MGSASLHPIRAARLAAGLSQMDLAYRAGVSLKTLERIENGQVIKPRPATLKVIAAELGITPDDLLEREAA